MVRRWGLLSGGHHGHSIGFVFSQFELVPSPNLSWGRAVVVVGVLLPTQWRLGALPSSMVLVLGLANCNFMSLPQMKHMHPNRYEVL